MRTVLMVGTAVVFAALLVACAAQPTTITSKATEIAEEVEVAEPPTAVPTATDWPSPSPTQTPRPTATSTPEPVWLLLEEFEEAQLNEFVRCYSCSAEPDGSWTLEVVPGDFTASLLLRSLDRTYWDQLELSSFQVDLLLQDTGYQGPWFGTGLDLHGIGPGGSWYATLGYQHNWDGTLEATCGARSYSYEGPSFGQVLDRRVVLDDWHTLKIEVVHTNEGWNYAFHYYLDGELVCRYHPPDRWDGTNRHRVEVQTVGIKPENDRNAGAQPIRVRVKDAYAFQ